MTTESKKTNETVKELTGTPIEGEGTYESETTAEKIERIQLELIIIRFQISTKATLLDTIYRGTLPLNSEKKRRTEREIMLRDELTKAQEQLKLKAELESSDDC